MRNFWKPIILPLIVTMGLPDGAARSETVENPMQESETWVGLKYDVIGDVTPADGLDLFTVDVPYRAHDAAIVPLHIKQNTASTLRIVRMVVVVDENPAPVAAKFDLGPGLGHLDMETRVRVDQYSNIRVIAETEDGGSFMNGRFVKASGGCSAPALKDRDAALANVGKMRLRLFETAAGGAVSAGRQAQVMIRHPNYSGMQRNQITQLFIPAFFVEELEVFLGDELLFRMEGGISISEDPVFRFSYLPNGAESFRIRATDTDGNVFERNFPAGSEI